MVKKNCVATRVDYEQNILHVSNKGKKESIEYGKLILCCSAPIQANVHLKYVDIPQLKTCLPTAAIGALGTYAVMMLENTRPQ